VLAYVFWHRARDGVGADEYASALTAFHERVGVPSWFAALERPPWGEDEGWWEDWYLVEGWAGLGRLNEAAVTGARKAPHDEAAALVADGTAGIYLLRAGRPERPGWAGWLSNAPEVSGSGVSVWQRQMVLGPTPEFAVLAPAPVMLPWPAVETGPR
jgi:hypothetical protein